MKTPVGRWMAAAAAAAATAVTVTVYLLACGPFVDVLRTVETISPANLNGYGYRGELGVVRPHFARRFLVQAYRGMTGAAPLPVVARRSPSYDATAQEAGTRWDELHRRFTGAPGRSDTERDLGDYQSIENCLGAAYASAAATLADRAARYGASSDQLRDWLRAQDQVFANCGGKDPVVPDPAPVSADSLARADRAYQIASAYFYAMNYDEAVRRFLEIARDPVSLWRPYGQYLAARARLRQATTAKTLDTARLAEAEAGFRHVLDDPGAAFLHGSARGLLGFIAARARPIERLRELSVELSAARSVDEQTLIDYERLMDTFVGDTTSFDYGTLERRAAIAGSSPMNDWILAMQGKGPEADARAVSEWKRTQSLPWLTAALWKATPGPEAEPLLDAAAGVDATSAAFATAGFLRVRLLVAAHRDDEARAALTALPSRLSPSRPPLADAETVNLLNALRFRLARTMDELLAAAPRRAVSNRSESWRYVDESDGPAPGQPVFDEDAGLVFSERLPLARLVEAAMSAALPPRLRLRVASAAFARAWMLKRFDEARAVAPTLRQLSPSLRDDMRQFEAAATPARRHIAGLRLLLRTPGLRASVVGMEDGEDYTQQDLRRDFDHVFRRNWWCGFGSREEHGDREDSELLRLVSIDGSVPSPPFLSKDEIASVQRERESLAALGTAATYLATEAVAWAKSQPADQDAAEALARAVEGTRWSCADDSTSRASRAAFTTLHQLFPKSEWALKTKYWY